MRVQNKKPKTLAKEQIKLYPVYKGKYKNDAGKNTDIHIMESKIITSFLQGIWEMISLRSEMHRRSFATTMATDIEEFRQGINPWKHVPQSPKDLEAHISSISNIFKYYGYEQAISEFSAELKEKFLNETKDLRIAKKGQIEKLHADKTRVEETKKNYRRNAYANKLDKEIIEEDLKYYDDQISRIQGQISEISTDTKMEAYLEKIPEILEKTVELVINPLRKAESEQLREDVKKLLEISTVELIITHKKELRIKLFDVLDALISSDKSVLEAPSGVEPDYGALQAPA